MLSPEPMDIDAPSEDAKRPPPPPPTALMSEDDEARQAIDMLRGEDVSARVAAANRLEAVAAALGHERTRDVSFSSRVMTPKCLAGDPRHEFFFTHSSFSRLSTNHKPLRSCCHF